jgi:hypothetical protein
MQYVMETKKSLAEGMRLLELTTSTWRIQTRPEHATNSTSENGCIARTRQAERKMIKRKMEK